jgi:hypothetical protein
VGGAAVLANNLMNIASLLMKRANSGDEQMNKGLRADPESC